MPNPLTPAPINETLVQATKNSQAWVSWFQLIWKYVLGFRAEVDTDRDMEVNTTYYVNDLLLVTLTVPERFKPGDKITVIGLGAGGWTIQLNTGQFIHGDGSTTAGGTLSSTDRYDSVTLEASQTDTTLSVISKVGTLTYA